MRHICKAASLLLVLSLLFCLMAACGGDSNAANTQPPAADDTETPATEAPATEAPSEGDNGGASADGKATVKITLILEDETEIPYEIHVTPGCSLREALYEAELIDEANFNGMFVSTIDGHTADAILDGVTWLPLDENGKQIQGTFDEITVSDGQSITLQYYVVPNFD